MSKQIDPTTTEIGEPKIISAGSGLSIFLLWLFVFVLAGIVAAVYFQLTQANITVTKQLSTLQQQTNGRVNELQVLSQSVRHLEEISTHDLRSTILNRWYVTEAQYLVRLAKNYIIFMHNTAAALVLLQQAEQVLHNIQDGSVDNIRHQLSQYIATLNTLATVDVTALYSQVLAAQQQVDKLIFPSSPLQQQEKATEPSIQDDPTKPWWKRGLERTLASFKEIVIVRYNATNTLPLVMPDEKNFLKQNLHSQLETVIWALLHHNEAIYNESLSQAIHWVQQYFMQQDATTISVLQALEALRAVNIDSPSIDMVMIMQQFDEYLKA